MDRSRGMTPMDHACISLPLRTERLLLRPFLSEDADALYAYLSDPEVTRFEPYSPMTRAQSDAELSDRCANGDFIAVCLPPDDENPFGTLIGQIFFTPCAFGTWEIAYMFNRSIWHNGYAAEAARAVIDAVFAGGLAHRVIAMCNPDNTPSERLLQRIGMRYEGRMVKNLYFETAEDGTPLWQDTVMYAVLENEWNDSVPAIDKIDQK